MTKAEFYKELHILLDEHIKEEKRIREEAEKNGTLLPGFDSNNGLFKDLEKESLKKFEQLKERYKKESTDK